MLDQFSATVEKIYAAAANASSWTKALTAIEDVTGSAGAVVHIITKADQPDLVSLLGRSAESIFPAPEVETWTREYAGICPRIAAASRWPTASYVCDHMILTESEMDTDPVYAWYEDHGIRYFVGSPLYETDRVQIVWSLQRSRNQGHVQRDDLALFELIKPHLARALTLADQISSLRSFETVSMAVLEALPQAVFGLDAKARVRFVNAAGAQLLRSDNGLNIAHGHLSCDALDDQTEVDRLIGEAASGELVATSGWTTVSCKRGERPYAVFVAPLRLPDEGTFADEARVLVMVHDPYLRRQLNPQMLSALYGLTETEARLSSAITEGHSLESAAALLNMRVTTARSHLKSVFAKLGVNRQQDIVRLLMSLPTMSL